MTMAIGPMIDSAIICLENTHRHLGLGATPARGRLSGCKRGGDARAGLDALHVPGALAAGLDAGPGPVSFQADGHGGRVFDDRGLHPVADAGPGLQRLLAQAARRRRRPRRTAGDEHGGSRAGPPHAEPETFRSTATAAIERAARHAAAGVRALGADDRRRDRRLFAGCSTSCCGTRS